MNLTLRDMRHTYATLALKGTSDPVAVMRSLGHKDLRMTETYLSSTVARTASASAAVAQEVFGVQKAADLSAAECQQQGVTINVSAAAKQWLAKQGYDRSMGARPMERLIQQTLKLPLADHLLFGKSSKKSRQINIELQHNEIALVSV